MSSFSLVRSSSVVSLVLEIREGHEIRTLRAERRPATEIGVVEELDPGTQMANRGAVMDDGIAFARRDPIGDRVDAELELQSGGDAVQRLETVAHRILSMCVQIDETGSEDQAARLDDLGCLERGLGDGHDRAVGDANVADGVEPRLRIHDACVAENELGGIRRRGLGRRHTRSARAKRYDRNQWAQGTAAVSHHSPPGA